MRILTRRDFLQAAVGTASISVAALAAIDPKVYPDRWFYVPSGLETDDELARIESITRTAAEHGLNGMLLSAGFDQLDLKPPDFIERLKHLKKTCDDLKVEIIPLGFSVGYGSGVLAHNKNLAAGLPVHGALFVAANDGRARFAADSPARIENGNFEHRRGHLPAGFTLHGGKASIDTQVFHSGNSSVRFDDFDGTKSESDLYLAQPVRVTPYRCYRLRCWVKAANVSPGTLFHLSAHAPDGRDLSYLEYHLRPNTDWQKVVWGFNSWYADHIEFRIALSEGRLDHVWVDDAAIEEVGLINVLRRPGTPVTVRGEKSGEIYEEGRDYAHISDPELNFHFDHGSPAIHLPAGSHIKWGERLRVDYFHGKKIYHDQVPIDLSEPEVYEIWKRQIPLLHKYLAPKKYFLSMDEVRIGGFCRACKERHLPMAEILGDCVKRQAQMIHAVDRGAQIFVWSDMFDPNHNARAKYYLIDGGFAGTWNYLPKGLVIACWYYEKRDKSLSFFSKRGYKTLAGAYYDADDLDNPKGWLAALDRTPGAVGIMYTTWQNKYKLLAAFGDLVSKR